MKQLLRLIAVTIAALAATAHPVGAADIGPFPPLTDTSQTASWSSEFPPGLVVASPKACVDSAVPVCDWVKVNVELPEDVWAKKPGGMLVAINPRTTTGNLFNLYIYAPGDKPLTSDPISKSESNVSFGFQGVWVENPVNGEYTVVVVPFGTLPPPVFSVPAVYDGFVSFDRGLTVKRGDELNNGMPYTDSFVAFGLSSPQPKVELLPDLVPVTPNDFHIETGTCIPGLIYICGGASPALRHQPSCYPEETAGTTTIPPNNDHPRRCLRFSQGEYNFGDGPLVVHLYPSEGRVAPDGRLLLDVYQRIYFSDGSVDQVNVGEAEYHESHGHFHNLGWRSAELHKLLPNGTAGEIVIDPTNGKEVTMTHKGVCVVDLVNARFGQRRDSPLAYGDSDSTAPSPCSNPSHQDRNDPTFPDSPKNPGGAHYIQSGISVGWADMYEWPLIDQYINITNVPDGKYALVTRVNVDQRVREKTTANNTAMACVEFSGITATAIPCSLPPPTSAMSRKTHGSAGTFDVDLPLTGNPGIECRSGGANNDYQLVVTFPSAVTFDSAAITSGTGTISGIDGSGTTALTVNLTGVTNAQTITLTISGVNDGTFAGDVGVRMGVLVGDTNANKTVSNGDVSSVQGQVGATVTQSNFRNDVNANGTLSNGDVAATQAKVGTQLP